jgi:hypothetical protein
MQRGAGTESVDSGVDQWREADEDASDRILSRRFPGSGCRPYRRSLTSEVQSYERSIVDEYVREGSGEHI